MLLHDALRTSARSHRGIFWYALLGRRRGGGVVLYVVCWFQAVQRLRSESLALVAGVHCASPEQLRTLCQEDVHVLHVPGNPTALTARSHPRLCWMRLP
jgi:hypothetical protein